MIMSTRKLALAALLPVLTDAPCRAEVTAQVQPLLIVSATGATMTVAVAIDLGASGSALGSYGAVLSWDAASLQYVGDSGGGEPPFDNAVVNRADVENGILRFGDASPTGATGHVSLLSVAFMALAAPPTTTGLDLEFTSAFTADDYDDLGPELEVQDGNTCTSDYFFDLRAVGQLDTVLAWNAIPGAVRYDVIRGDLDQPYEDGSSVRLGVVTCIENDSLDTTTGAGTEPANPDTETPPAGEGFFYLVRFDGVAAGSYGFALACTRERVADAGDCP
jgi:hypothetical protein